MVSDKLFDSGEGPVLELLILLNVGQSERAFEYPDVVFVVFEGVVDGVSLLEFDGINGWILHFLVAE